MFLRAARHAELDPMRGVSANVMCGQEGNFGTGSFQLMLDADQLETLQPQEQMYSMDTNIAIEEGFGDLAPVDDKCGIQNIVVQTNASRIQSRDTGLMNDDDYDPDF